MRPCTKYRVSYLGVGGTYASEDVVAEELDLLAKDESSVDLVAFIIGKGQDERVVFAVNANRFITVLEIGPADPESVPVEALPTL